MRFSARLGTPPQYALHTSWRGFPNTPAGSAALAQSVWMQGQPYLAVVAAVAVAVAVTAT